MSYGCGLRSDESLGSNRLSWIKLDHFVSLTLYVKEHPVSTK